MWLSGLYFYIWCRSLFWFALACSLFLPLLLVGLGIGLLIAVCFLALAAVAFGWLGFVVLLCYFMGLLGFLLGFFDWWFWFVG